MERLNNKKVYTGLVVSDVREKTITVQVESTKLHPIYSKRVKVSKKFHAHDENGEANVGDTVTIIESRPYSKTKTFRLLEVVNKAEVV